MNFKKIIVPFDFSDESLNAFEYAINFAKVTGGKVTLFHVIEAPVAESFNPMGEIKAYSRVKDADAFTYQLLKRTRERIKALLNRPAYKPYVTQEHVEMDNMTKQVGKIITSHEADIIIMGTKGASGYKEVFGGSNAERVVGRAQCPVLVLKDNNKFSGINNIAYCSTFEDEHPVLSRLLIQLSELFNATLHLVRINTDSDYKSSEELYEKIERFAENYDLSNYTISIYDYNDVEEGIIKFASETEPDLLAVNAPEHKGISRVFSTSTAEELANHAKFPVLSMSLVLEEVEKE